MHANIQVQASAVRAPSAADRPRMTAAMREGLEALQREYEAFRESSLKTLALIAEQRTGSK